MVRFECSLNKCFFDLKMMLALLRISNQVSIVAYKHSFSFEGSKETKIPCETEDTSLYLSFTGDIHVAFTPIQIL